MKANKKAQALVGIGLLISAVVVAGGAAAADEAPPPAFANLSNFAAQAVAGVADFQYQYSKIGVIPFAVKGGVLASFSDASSSGARGVAGVMPVPLLADGQLINPTNDPITGSEVPEEFREGYGKIDFRKFPNQCFSEYPDIFDDGRDEAYCGGPASDDPALGYTFGAFNGHTKSSGVEDDPNQTKSVSTSRLGDVVIPALQATVHGAWAETRTGTNREGLAESTSLVDIDSIEILNGLIKLTGVRSEAIALTDGTETGSRTSTSFTVASAYVAGFPVVIGPEGVTVNKEQLPAGTSIQDANKSVSEALANGDLNIRLAPAPAADKAGSAVSIRSAGVEIVNRGEKFTPANSYYRFPYVSVTANAVAESPDSYGEGTDITTGGEGTDLTGGTDTGSGDSTSTPTSDSLVEVGTEPASFAGMPGVSFSSGTPSTATGSYAAPLSDATQTAAGLDPPATAENEVALVPSAGPTAPRQYAAQRVAAIGGLPSAETKDLAAMLAAVALAAAGAVFTRRAFV